MDCRIHFSHVNPCIIYYNYVLHLQVADYVEDKESFSNSSLDEPSVFRESPSRESPSGESPSRESPSRESPLSSPFPAIDVSGNE